jgi:hypothetical protein
MNPLEHKIGSLTKELLAYCKLLKGTNFSPLCWIVLEKQVVFYSDSIASNTYYILRICIERKQLVP